MLILLSREKFTARRKSNCKPRESHNYGLLQFALHHRIKFSLMHLLSLYRSVLHLGITIVMHRYPRVGHAGTTYMACNKIDRSIHTKNVVLSWNNLQTNHLFWIFQSLEVFCKLLFSYYRHPSNMSNFQHKRLNELLESLERVESLTFFVMRWINFVTKMTERPFYAVRWKFGKINIFNNKR